jgi:hypothetical protein
LEVHNISETLSQSKYKSRNKKKKLYTDLLNPQNFTVISASSESDDDLFSQLQASKRDKEKNKQEPSPTSIHSLNLKKPWNRGTTLNYQTNNHREDRDNRSTLNTDGEEE